MQGRAEQWADTASCSLNLDTRTTRVVCDGIQSRSPTSKKIVRLRQPDANVCCCSHSYSDLALSDAALCTDSAPPTGDTCGSGTGLLHSSPNGSYRVSRDTCSRPVEVQGTLLWVPI